MNIIFVVHNCNLSFLESELRFLLNHEKVDQIKIFTDFPVDDHQIAFHDKCEVILIGKISTELLKVKMRGILFSEFLNNIFWYVRNKKWNELSSVLRNHLRKSNFIIKNEIQKTDIIYSYWAGSGAFIISILKKAGLRNMALTRLHAFDIYEDGDNKGHIPWRHFIYKKLSHLVTISEHGKSYLEKHYPFTENKITTLKLGIIIRDFGLNIAPLDILRVVSCSWVGRRKNLKGVFEAFQDSRNIEWTHIGDGEDFDSLKKGVLKSDSNLKVNLRGRLQQKEIHNVYNNEQFSCFISLSTNEGLPVSMMEAMAHGIPVVSTDVGGCAEIVNENTGVLLPKNYTDDDVRNAVYLCAEKFKSPESRQRIQNFIKENFDAEKNYGKFVDFLEQANKEHHSKLEND
jgi:glycosyltransferase involved in cell wall biosynthesis